MSGLDKDDELESCKYLRHEIGENMRGTSDEISSKIGEN